MTNFSILAIQSLVENCQLVWGEPYEYEHINWQDPRPIPTKEAWEKEKARLIAYQPKQNCKDEAKRKIQACDWSVLQDVKLLNQTEFINYRVILRDYILNPTENPDFPPEPNPIWAI